MCTDTTPSVNVCIAGEEDAAGLSSPAPTRRPPTLASATVESSQKLSQRPQQQQAQLAQQQTQQTQHPGSEEGLDSPLKRMYRRVSALWSGAAAGPTPQSSPPSSFPDPPPLAPSPSPSPLSPQDSAQPDTRVWEERFTHSSGGSGQHNPPAGSSIGPGYDDSAHMKGACYHACTINKSAFLHFQMRWSVRL